MGDQFSNHAAGLASPAMSSETADITSSDHTFDDLPRFLWVAISAATGALKVRLPGDSADITINLASTGVVPIRPSVIRRTGSTNISQIFGLGGRD